MSGDEKLSELLGIYLQVIKIAMIGKVVKLQNLLV
jgi:hypothetical protein